MAEVRRCPTCLEEVPDQTFVGVGPRMPQENDRTVCACCGAISVFTADLMLRHPTDEELLDSLAMPGVQVARLIHKLVRKARE